MTVFLTSDEHYGHRNVISYCGRPFVDVDEMDRELIARFNAVVTPDDETWHLGDFSLDERITARILPLLNGKHHLVMGNHDKCHPHRSKHLKMKRRYHAMGFITVEQRHVFAVDGLGPVLATHMPRSGGPDVRYAEYRPDDWGGPILCGHIHEKWLTCGNQLNIGVDVHQYAPIRFDDAVDLLRQAVEESGG